MTVLSRGLAGGGKAALRTYKISPSPAGRLFSIPRNRSRAI